MAAKQLKSGILLLTLVFLTSCGNNGDESIGSKIFPDVLPESNGGMLEVLVVADDKVWDGEVGAKIKENFISPQYGLPQPESEYILSRIRPKSFNDLLKRSRNIVIFNTGGEESYVKEDDKWARPQHVYFFSASDNKALAALIEAKDEEMLKNIRQNEVDRLISKGKKKINPVPSPLKKLGYALNIPEDYEKEVETDGFAMYWKRTLKSDQGIFIHIKPMPADDGALGGDIIPLRDSLTKIYYPGEREGSYMKTETLIAPKMRGTEIDGKYAMESRGLWRTEGDLLGGPFISYTIYDDAKGKIITLDAFTLAPDIDKRNLLFEEEAILKSFKSIN